VACNQVLAGRPMLLLLLLLLLHLLLLHWHGWGMCCCWVDWSPRSHLASSFRSFRHTLFKRYAVLKSDTGHSPLCCARAYVVHTRHRVPRDALVCRLKNLKSDTKCLRSDALPLKETLLHLFWGLFGGPTLAATSRQRPTCLLFPFSALHFFFVTCGWPRPVSSWIVIDLAEGLP
jgi:hypothetical protein